MSKRIPIYFSDHAWACLENIMGPQGKPSPIINSLIESTAVKVNPKIHQVIKQTNVLIPIALERISAGFPSPAQDYIDQKIDLNNFLVGNELATFMVEVNSLSMLGAGIDIDDKLIVDRSLEAMHNDIVVALIDNEFTVKRLIIEPDKIYLQAENPDYRDIHFKDEQQLIIWGVVTNIIKSTRKRK